MLGPPFDDRWELYGQLHRLTDFMLQLEAEIGEAHQFFELTVTLEQRDAARDMMKAFYSLCEKLVPKAIADASAVVFEHEQVTDRNALSNFLREVRPRPSATYSAPDARVVELEPLITALSALNVGETLPLLERDGASGKSTKSYTLLKHKLLALCWQAYLAKRTDVRKAATDDVCRAFGVSRQSLNNWRTQCEAGLGSNRVRSAIASAERETLIPTVPYTAFFRKSLGLPDKEGIPVHETLEGIKELLLVDGAAYAAAAGK